MSSYLDPNPKTLDEALALIADLSRRLARSEAERRAIANFAEIQSSSIRHLKATLDWLQREHPLPVWQGVDDPYGLMHEASKAAGRLPR
jgi:hypothetical protein